MRHLKLARVSVIAAAALAVGLTVSAAAAAPRLAILEPTTRAPAPNGYPNLAFVVFVASHSPEIFCEQVTEGTLRNDRPTDRDTLSGPFNDSCTEVASGNVVPATGYSIAGGFRRITLSWTGFSEITGGTASVSEPGPCVYDFHSLQGSIPGSELFTFAQALVEGQAEGSLDRAESSIACEQAQALHFLAFLESVEPPEFLNAEVKG
jgi:hypothetical protein